MMVDLNQETRKDLKSSWSHSTAELAPRLIPNHERRDSVLPANHRVIGMSTLRSPRCFILI